MYCKCDHPKKKVSEANGEKFTICAKSLGGCGEEYLEGIVRKSSEREFRYMGADWAKDPDQGITITFVGDALDIKVSPPESVMVVCPECDGGCFTMVCYGGMPVEKNCERCDGAGEVEDI